MPSLKEDFCHVHIFLSCIQGKASGPLQLATFARTVPRFAYPYASKTLQATEFTTHR